MSDHTKCSRLGQGKQRGPKTNDDYFAIYSLKSINFLKFYVELFRINTRTYRFTRYIVRNATGMVGTLKPVGKNSLQCYGMWIASFLELPTPELYTSHFLKRTAATLIANAGGTTLQIQRAGNWRSLRVAEGYAARGRVAKRATSDLIGLLEVSPEQRMTAAITTLTVRQSTEIVEPVAETTQEPPGKIQKAEQQYNFTFDFRRATSINLATFQLCNSAINPSVSTNLTTSNESSSIVSAVASDSV